MIKLNEVDDDTTYVITLQEQGNQSNIIIVPEGNDIGFNTTSEPQKVQEVKYANITLTGKDLKKLILILNLSIGNLPENAPDITGLVDQITKGIGFQK